MMSIPMPMPPRRASRARRLGLAAGLLLCGAAPVKPMPAGDPVPLPGGVFLLGNEAGDEDERPVQKVTLRPYALDRTEVSVAAYRACVAAGACSAPATTVYWEGITREAQAAYSQACNWERPGRERHPVNCVTWAQARAYCAWSGGRLPSEAEWEVAARGPGRRVYPWGDSPPGPALLNACGGECAAPGDQALYPKGDGFPTSAPVGSFPAGRSPEGLLDMAGNVWEWTESRYCPYDRPTCDDPRRVLRGGAWNVTRPEFLRAAYRFRSPPSFRYDLVGFRCARPVPPG
jgi:formylglycine-generating enzyme required for sulfatase activity